MAIRHRQAMNVLSKPQPAQPPGDFVMVPREPTEAMLDKAEAGSVSLEFIQQTVKTDVPYWRALVIFHWKQMLAAAPVPSCNTAWDARDLVIRLQDCRAATAPNDLEEQAALITAFAARIRAEAVEECAKIIYPIKHPLSLEVAPYMDMPDKERAVAIGKMALRLELSEAIRQLGKRGT